MGNAKKEKSRRREKNGFLRSLPEKISGKNEKIRLGLLTQGEICGILVRIQETTAFLKDLRRKDFSEVPFFYA
ncbi:MAG: hypothetical protein Q4D62_10380 [Planctomycetia bacterium]|nr:hypothetical protein [Planctomycetia bacterium]